MGAGDRVGLERLGEGVAIFAEVGGTDAVVADEQPPRRLVGKLNAALAVDREQGRRRVVEHGFVKAAGVGQPVPLLAKAAYSLVQRLADLGEAASAAARKTLRKVAQPDRLEEARDLDIGA